MSSATDIITYIGVPLAVIGVLPILYTFALALVTQRKIYRTLIKYGHRPANTRNSHDGFTIRGSPMTSLIEVELPRYAIAPLERNTVEYWRPSRSREDAQEHHKLIGRVETTMSMIEQGRVQGYLRGGSWRGFNWKKLPVGRKLYRIQYEDELKEPPADIDFSQLVNFLLDWGAELNPAGWEKLKTAGLWTPAGTVLLQLGPSPDAKETRSHHDWVLRTGTPDDSEGILTLCVQWPQDERYEGLHSSKILPPGWARLRQPVAASEESTAADQDDLISRLTKCKLECDDLLPAAKCNSVRFAARDNMVNTVHWETDRMEIGFESSLSHLDQHNLNGQNIASEWFTAAIAALVDLDDSADDIKKGTFDTFHISSQMTNFLTNSSMPCGVLVLLDILSDSEAPDWETEKENPVTQSIKRGQQLHARHDARAAAARIEATMSPEQAMVHKMNREREEMQTMLQDSIREQRERREKIERRERDAINSPRMSCKTTAEYCLAHLIKTNQIPASYSLYDVVQAILFLFVVDRSKDGEVAHIISVLAEWIKWSEAAGMKVEQLRVLEKRTVELCLAACLAAVIAEKLERHASSATTHMLACLAAWKTVRLG